MQRFKQALLSALPKSQFARGVGVLVGGTASAQALGVLTLPALTRLYSPADFTVFAVYSSILGILASVACLRLEIAIPIAEAEADAASLLTLALLSATMFALIAGLIVFIFPAELVGLVKQPDLTPYLWLIPIGVLFAGLYAALQYWATRARMFGLIARTRLTQAVGGAGSQIGFGFAHAAPFGLMFGQLIGSGSGIISIGSSCWQSYKPYLMAVRPKYLATTFRKFGHYPKYSTFETLFNVSHVQLPILVIAAVAVGPEAGFLVLASRIMGAPISLIGGAISQVFLSRAPDEMRQGKLAPFSKNVLETLIKNGIGPLLCIGIVAPAVFPFLFGERWARAGEILTLMTPWFAMQLLVSPVSMVLHLKDRQKLAFYIQAFGLFIRVGAVLLAAFAAPHLIVETHAITGFIFYSVYLVVVMHVAHIEFSDLASVFGKAWTTVVAWVVSAACIHIFLGYGQGLRS